MIVKRGVFEDVYGTVLQRCAIWLKLDCLNPNDQRWKHHIRRYHV